jgi:hypothetical protein
LRSGKKGVKDFTVAVNSPARFLILKKNAAPSPTAAAENA